MRAGNSLLDKRVYEFEHFRIDVAEGILESAGRRISVAPKALDVLIALIKRRGHLVLKEDLISEVWPDLFVEENNLAFNVSVLRKLLGESSASPRYIETVPKRGYRFICEVTEIPAAVPREPAEMPASLNGTSTMAASTNTPGRAGRSRARTWLAAGLAVTAATVALVMFFHPARPKFTDRDLIVVADFVNQTGEPLFDDTLRQGLTAQLEQSPYLSLISEHRIRQMLLLMSRPADTRLTPELARDVCERAGGAAVLEGSIARLGSQYVLGLSAKNCRTGEVLDHQQLQASGKEDVLSVLSQIARKFRSHTGESLATIRSHDTPLADATTRSMEALKVYSAAWKVHATRGATASLPLFKRATEIDPDFAMAHAFLGRIYADMDQPDLSAASVARAWQLRNHASDRERFFITANYALLVTGNLEQARQTCEMWAQIYPRDALPHSLLSGMVNKVLGRYEKAAAEAERAVELDPDFGIPYYNLAVDNAYMNRFSEAEKGLQRAASRGLDGDEFRMLSYDLAFLKNDAPEMERLSSGTKSFGESWLLNKQAFALAYSGHLQQAKRISQSAAAEAQQDGQDERAALWEAGAAVREAFWGNALESRTLAEAALVRSHNRDVEYGAALSLALSGDSLRAQTVANNLSARFPEDTSVQFSYLPVLRARLALNRTDPAAAVMELQAAAPLELGSPPSSIGGTYGALYPIYMRGEAYLRLGRGAEAAAEFQKILDHSGIVLADPVGALARLQLGRALALAGEKQRSKVAYERLLELWKDADPETPLLQQAKREYLQLQ
jgi:DNA-binding winged helix-turn-helix (wHTH) protein/tetratricopeptide (TPR) repeat protein